MSEPAKGFAGEILEEKSFEEEVLEVDEPFSWTEPGGRFGTRTSTGELPSFRLRIGHDLWDLARSPRWLSRRGWRRFGYGLLAIGTVRLFDDEIRELVATEDQGSYDLARRVRPMGQHEGLALLALAWLGARATDNSGLRAVSEDAFEATLLSSGLISASLKVLVGRPRPDGSDDLSFPSGDATQAFAIASVIAAHSEKRWVDVLSYSMAGLVAWERVRLDRHWGSDVVASAILGAAVGRWVVRRNRGGWKEEHRFALTPLVGGETYGVGMRIAF